jgi:hypothetical protein
MNGLLNKFQSEFNLHPDTVEVLEDEYLNWLRDYNDKLLNSNATPVGNLPYPLFRDKAIKFLNE